jgi:hypothetical protein
VQIEERNAAEDMRPWKEKKHGFFGEENEELRSEVKSLRELMRCCKCHSGSGVRGITRTSAGNVWFCLSKSLKQA